MFRKILIANRGEIALRIHRSATKLGIRTIAIHSAADRASRHVRELDEAILIEGATARAGYLDSKAIIAAALATGAEAIHPGYGFLSENAEFAEAIAAAGLVFIGPPAAAIRAMGSKSAAKALMAASGVPIVPGYHGEDQSDDIFAAEAARIGYPVLVKAVMGGGGKGMRRVERAEDLADALASARREAEAAFGDRALLIEKYLARPRHIEMQIFADTQGGILHLFERDCSLQRRHQKVIEEAPAPGFSEKQRRGLAEAAIAAARAIAYVGAGTVEFIADARDLDHCYFMEMNTRLQVEHPVTEAITGLDLVEWQLRIAAGEALPKRQEEIAIRGHAIEARICAEDPTRDFLPASGILLDWHMPTGPHLRLDGGFGRNDRIGLDYDSLLAKFIAWGEDRATAIAHLSAALGAARIAGCASNLDLLERALAHPDFRAGRVETGFISAHPELLAPIALPIEDGALLALGEYLALEAESAAAAAISDDPHSPWHEVDHWRIGGQRPFLWHYRQGESEIVATMTRTRRDWEVAIGGDRCRLSGRLEAEGRLVAEIDGEKRVAYFFRDGPWRWLHHAGRRHRLRFLGLFAAIARRDRADGAATGTIVAPMPGRIVAIPVAAGTPVEAGAVIVLLEAMKMEHGLTAPIAGVIGELTYRPGDLVAEGEILARIEPAQNSGPAAS